MLKKRSIRSYVYSILGNIIFILGALDFLIYLFYGKRQ